jgi:hypothetical protein
MGKIHFLPHRKHTASTAKNQLPYAIKGNYPVSEKYKNHINALSIPNAQLMVLKCQDIQ